MRNTKSSNRHENSTNPLALLGGAALGAMAMYLLDPEAGRRRRETLREAAGETLDSTRHALGPAFESIGERARDFSSRFAEGASSLGSGIADRASDASAATGAYAGSAYGSTRDWLSNLGDSMSGWAHRTGRRARHARDSASDSAYDYAHRARQMLPWHEEEKNHAAAYTAAGITAAALGAASIYLFDPTNGRRRRKEVTDQAHRIVNECGRCARQTGRRISDMMNRGRGLAHEARNRVMPGAQDVSPETLIQRIRSQMGHVVADAGSIAVMVNRDGAVTLSGPVQSSELDALLAMVNKTPGVTELINRLDVQGATTTSGSAPRL